MAEDDWRYFPGSQEPPSNWNQLGFASNSWSEGPGGIGYGDGDDNTVIDAFPSLYMRQEFVIEDLDEVLAAVLNADYDDGYVAYLNGTEIARSNNISGQPPTFDTYTSSFSEAQLYSGGVPSYEVLSDAELSSLMVEGNNVLAVQVHNYGASSSDMTGIFYLSVGVSSSSYSNPPPPSWFSFDQPNEYYHTNFKLGMGEYVILSDQNAPIDGEEIPDDLRNGLSRGRAPGGSASWCYFDEMTPDTLNFGNCYEGIAAPPEISLASGWYDTSQSATISALGSTVHFTRDGDFPYADDPIAPDIVLIDETGIISARAYSDQGLLPSAVVDRTYIIDQDNYELPVISIKTDSLNLWGYYQGIYVSGPNAGPDYPYFGSNFWQPWSKFARMEIFGADKSLLAEEQFDLEIHGGWSRAEPQKSFRCDLKSQYTGSVEIPLFSTKPEINDINNFNLRNGGQHVWSDKIQDAMISHISQGTHVDISAFEPCIVYLNGDYWGIYGLREKVDEHYVEDNHGVNSENVDLLNALGPLSGSALEFVTDYDELMNEPVDSEQFYEMFSDRFDIENYIDYFVIETFVENLDWMGIAWSANNIKLWRPRTQDGKWRYVLFDTDAGLGAFGTMPTMNYIELARQPAFPSMHSQLFDKVLDNPEFKCAFTNRYADLMNSIFRQAFVDEHVDEIVDRMIEAMPDHLERWEAPASLNEWLSYVEIIRDRVSTRLPYARNHVNASMGMDGQVDITLDVMPAGTGFVRISTFEPMTYPWSGVYYNGCPVNIEAIADSGYVFSHWSINSYLSEQETEPS
ncbi:MAG: hypothetical protein HKN45_10995, partial [Flavobacteriales bacterium]|nr:hypothetical protein [Flavobacteriales bacterium]